MGLHESSNGPLRLENTHVVLYEEGDLWFQPDERTQPGRRTLCNVPFDVWAHDPLGVEALNRGFYDANFEERRLACVALREQVLAVLCVEPIVAADPEDPLDSEGAWHGVLHGLFHGCSKLVDIADLDMWDVSDARDLSRTFQGCESLADLSGLEDWNVWQVERMVATFAGCAVATADALAPWDTSSLRDLGALFADCNELTDLSGLAGWNLSGAESLDEVFSGCSSLADLSPLACWDVSSARSMDRLFCDCSSLATLSGLEAWQPHEVTSMAETFGNCAVLTDVAALGSWGFGYVAQTMSGMFCGCSSLADLSPLAQWVPAVDMSHCLCGTAITDLSPLAGWDTYCTKDMTGLFEGCSALVSATPLSGWGPLPNLCALFKDCSSLVDVSGLASWDFSRRRGLAWDGVRTPEDICLRETFSGCSALEDVSALESWRGDSWGWDGEYYDEDFERVPSMEGMFDGCPAKPPSWYAEQGGQGRDGSR